MNCPQGHDNVILVEYGYEDPYRYDGISEIVCKTCSCRYGRWTGKILEGQEKEPPYGDPKLVTDEVTIYNL